MFIGSSSSRPRTKNTYSPFTSRNGNDSIHVRLILFTLNAVRNVKPVYLKAARVMGLPTGETIRLIIFPSALPEIFSGLRIGFSLTLIGTLLGEMFASQRGLGFLLMNAIGLHNVDVIVMLTFLLVGFAALAGLGLMLVHQKILARG